MEQATERYEKLSVLGQGSFGDVYRLHRPRDGNTFAGKFLRETWDPAAKARFQDEASRQMRAAGPGVVPIIGSNFDSEQFIVMPLMLGGSLRKKFQQEPSSGRACCCAVDLVADIAEALAQVHARGIVHHDVKPENILFDGDSRPALSDFGCAVTCFQANDGCGLPPCCTLEYAAPEHKTGTGQKGDIYALGVILYESVMGRPLPVGWWAKRIRWPSQTRACTNFRMIDPMIQRLAAQEPQLRPTAQEAVAELRKIHTRICARNKS